MGLSASTSPGLSATGKQYSSSLRGGQVPGLKLTLCESALEILKICWDRWRYKNRVLLRNIEYELRMQLILRSGRESSRSSIRHRRVKSCHQISIFDFLWLYKCTRHESQDFSMWATQHGRTHKSLLNYSISPERLGVGCESGVKCALFLKIVPPDKEHMW